ncbi:MAG TPA: 2-dehydro-3-deoxygalactonokinase [Sphingomicrobium sp.]|nr:2-dehydro-3-deoxygalactonokinase [Sphingomicrobium sp.]
MKGWADGFIAVDWGTTNRRAYLVEGGVRAGEFEDGKGILSVERDAFGAAVEEVRAKLGDRPMLLAGMVGSNRGWIEAPYVDCPAGLAEIAARLVWPEEGRTAIVPGIAYRETRADVIRGEEVQLIGAVKSGATPDDCLVCHPGTHNKWVQVRDGRIRSFRTVMTGELFNLLKEHSILSDLLQIETTTGDAFAEGIERGLAGAAIAAELFEARAGCLLGKLDRADASSFVSGLLIGADVRVGLAEYPGAELFVMGRPELTRLYSAALAVAGVEAQQVDGEEAFLAGARAIVERIQ